MIEKRTCSFCRKDFSIEKRLINRFCSKVCRYKNISKNMTVGGPWTDGLIELECSKCNKKFKRKNKILKAKEELGKYRKRPITTNFCSLECYHKYKCPGKKFNNLKCHYCHKSFVRDRAHNKNINGKVFCSRTCNLNNMKNKTEMVALSRRDTYYANY